MVAKRGGHCSNALQRPPQDNASVVTAGAAPGGSALRGSALGGHLPSRSHGVIAQRPAHRGVAVIHATVGAIAWKRRRFGTVTRGRIVAVKELRRGRHRRHQRGYTRAQNKGSHQGNFRLCEHGPTSRQVLFTPVWYARAPCCWWEVV